MAQKKKEKRHMKLSTFNRTTNIIVYVLLVIMAIIWLYPFVAIVLDSFRMESTGTVGYVWPKQWGFGNYKP